MVIQPRDEDLKAAYEAIPNYRLFQPHDHK